MTKPRIKDQAYSRYAQDAAELLGVRIHNARMERKWTKKEVAERAGVSRKRVDRIEEGYMGCSIGAVFEVAALLGVQLFDADRTVLAQHLAMEREKLALLPKRARVSKKAVKDDF